MELDDNEPENIVSAIAMLLLLIIFDCIIVLGDFYSSFCQVPQYLLNVLLHVRGVWGDSKHCNVVEVKSKKPCFDSNASQRDKLDAVLTQNTCCQNKDLDNEEITIREVTMVMRKLGTPYDLDGDKFQDKLGSNDITALFEEQEPSLQEVKEAFCMFDKNNDGFIDASELSKVLAAFCFAEASEADCRDMIKAFDKNGDGVIDFDEFVRLLANSFS